MPKRTDIERILVIGSGPIVIGQAGEFDYSGSQACKALLEAGYETILVNNNPATIMTDPDFATRVYVEPLVPDMVEKIIARERPDALLPTVGGQTAINLSIALDDAGILDEHGVELIGAQRSALELAEDRLRFKTVLDEDGVPTLRSELADSMAEALASVERLGLPVVVRPSYTLGGEGGGIAADLDSFRDVVDRGLTDSPVHQVLIEESVLGWKEFELELIRDLADNAIVICGIENVDPMGVHTGESITVAPTQTLTDREYQRLRDLGIQVIRTVGVETGGSNVQFAVHPDTGRLAVIEMNPRVSRSSALASKATGFPIAKIAAKLAVGYTLDELPNDITQTTRAGFEPTIDYCVVKIPRWNVEKFPDASATLTTEMKSVGEAMAMGRTFKEALQKAVRSLELERPGLVDPYAGQRPLSPEWLAADIAQPRPDRLFKLYGALGAGVDVATLHRATGIDPWFLHQLQEIAELERQLRHAAWADVDPSLLRHAKRLGFADEQLARLWGVAPERVRQRRMDLGIKPVYKTVDTCAAEFEAQTPYFYSTYETLSEARPSDRPKAMVLGGGPYRIGQGIEFDYCCCQAAFALAELGYETILVNCNPETVSTDYDTSDRLYFEPVTLENVLDVVEVEQPDGVIVQYGGQTPLKLALGLKAAGVPVWGTDPAEIDRAEDRRHFEDLLHHLDVPRPRGTTATSEREAVRAAREFGFPVLVRPSYVLGGRAMVVAHDERDLVRYMTQAVEVSPDHPVLIDKFLDGAIEVDVDAVADGERCVVAGVMQHIEEAGVHSGDSACVLPPHSLSPGIQETIRAYTERLARELNVVGLLNVQYAVKDGEVYVIEVNPRASRTVPFVSKATGLPWAKVGAWVMGGWTLDKLGIDATPTATSYAVKAPVFPFGRFWVDPVLGPEMKSTGEVMGVGETLGEAYVKTQLTLKTRLPLGGTVLLSVADADKPRLGLLAERLDALGFRLLATPGTAETLRSLGLTAEVVCPIHQGHPNVLDRLTRDRVQLVINTPLGKASHRDDAFLRLTALRQGIPYVTTLAGANAAVAGIEASRHDELVPWPLPPTRAIDVRPQ
ncbi:MAG: carbamoyl-phosphate synthase large subunit [Candidatus Bipolaricaulia bacterium]